MTNHGAWTLDVKYFVAKAIIPNGQRFQEIAGTARDGCGIVIGSFNK